MIDMVAATAEPHTPRAADAIPANIAAQERMFRITPNRVHIAPNGRIDRLEKRPDRPTIDKAQIRRRLCAEAKCLIQRRRAKPVQPLQLRLQVRIKGGHIFPPLRSFQIIRFDEFVIVEKVAVILPFGPPRTRFHRIIKLIERGIAQSNVRDLLRPVIFTRPEG